MELLSAWLERKYLDWQKENGRISMAKWAEVLGIDKVYLNQMMNGRRKSTTMQTAYQIGEQLNDFEILSILGYPRPDVPLEGFSESDKTFILSLLDNMKDDLLDLSPQEREEKLKQILSSVNAILSNSPG